MPSFAELKERANKAKDAGVTKFQNTKDRHTSVPLKSTNWDPYSGKPPPPPPPQPRSSIGSRSSSSLSSRPAGPPPPPPRSGSSGSGPSSAGPPPPPVKRATRPPISASGPPPAYVPQAQGQDIDWTNLSPEDKAVFFSWLDEFFERTYGIRVA